MVCANKKETVKRQNEWIKENYDRINLTIPKGKKEVIKKYAKECGMSVNQLIWNLIEKETSKNRN